jgi:hypothetical protein
MNDFKNLDIGTTVRVIDKYNPDNYANPSPDLFGQLVKIVGVKYKVKNNHTVYIVKFGDDKYDLMSRDIVGVCE